MFSQYLTKDRITLCDEARSWEDAIRLAAAPLLAAGSVTKGYVDAMINSVKKSGPYIVIDEGLALPHARPEDGANAPDISLLILKKPVDLLGKPVSVFAALAAADSNSHVGALQQLARLVWAGGDAQKLSSFDDAEALIEYINKTLEEAEC